ncbi:MAG: glycosyltransferase [Minisyncoccota bacterium]
MKRAYKKQRTVCFFGIFDPRYSRNRVLIRGFEENGYEVVHCRISPHEHTGMSKFPLLIREYWRLREKTFDLVIVAFPGHTVVWLARILFGRGIIFDGFVSLYNSNVEDRKRYRARSWRGRWDWFLDWYSFRLAPVVLFDTNTHITYIAKKFSLPVKKFRRVFVGTDDMVFKPQEQKKGSATFVVHFHGTFIPLHGVEYIIEAAKLLEEKSEILFEIIGDGQERKTIETKMEKIRAGKNIRLLPKVPYCELAEYVSRADVCLGIFGTTRKAEMVIPNKVFEAHASKKPVITMASKAIRELCTDREDIVLCRSGNPADLVAKILLLRNDATLRERVAEGGYRVLLTLQQ